MDTINFTRGVPANESYPIDEVIEAATAALRARGVAMLQYGPALGFAPLREWLERTGLPVRAPVRRVVTRRLKQAYPIYNLGYETHFGAMDEWLAGIQGLLTFGRQGLFAHDNTHHALYMAYTAVECFGADGNFNWELWRNFRKVFETHVVED